MIDEKTIKNCRNIFQAFPKVKLAYFFGSQATGNQGPMSDYDFAVYLDEQNVKKTFDVKFSLQDKLGRLLKTNAVDIVLLNSAVGPEIKYQIIAEGRLIYEQEPYRVLVEPRILSEYFDFNYMMRKYNLTKA